MPPKLTDRDWTEIYYALESKALRVDAGDYGKSDPDVDVRAWARHLRAIMRKIIREVDV